MRSGEKVGGGGFSLLLTVEVMNDADDNPLLLPPNAMAFTSIFFFLFFPFSSGEFWCLCWRNQAALSLSVSHLSPASLIEWTRMDCSCPRVITSLPTRT